MKDDKTGGPFANDDLDEEVRAADDTGMVAQQQDVIAEELLRPEASEERSKDEE